MKKLALLLALLLLCVTPSLSLAQEEVDIIKEHEDPSHYSCQELASEIFRLQEYIYNLKSQSNFDQTGTSDNPVAPYGQEVEKAQSRVTELKQFRDSKHCQGQNQNN